MNIWTGLLFLEGAVADASLARELTQDAAGAAAAFLHEPIGAESGAPAVDRGSTGLHPTP